MERIRVLIADEHTSYREGIRSMLMTVSDIEVIGEARTGDETISLVTRLQPDVILMDIKMPGTNGIEATRTILQAHPQIRILMVTMFEDDGFVFTAMRSGARGYVLKDADQEDLVRAVRSGHRGQANFSQAKAQS